MHWADLKRRWDYWLRNKLRFSRPDFREKSGSLDIYWREHPDLKTVADHLLAQYPRLEVALPRMDPQRVRENLNALAALDQLYREGHTFTDTLSGRVLEVGVKNWSTVDALMAFLDKHVGSIPHTDGVELDPYRLYPSGHTRWDAARYYAHRYPQAKLIAGNMLDLTGPYNTIVIFLPFVFPDPHAAWGLPDALFQPEAYFAHLVGTLLLEGGHLFIVNQGEAECNAQAELLKPFDLIMHFQGEIRQPFYPLKYARYGWHLQKPLLP